MKREASKKSKLWLWLTIGIVALVAVAGVVLAVVLGGGGKQAAEGPKGGRADLYWNVDRKFYTENSESGLSTREPGADGVYTVRFAHNGGLEELPVADKQLINYIDTMDCMGIVQDSDGTVIDVVDPKTLATETARMFYVRKVEGNTITLNSSMAMNGMSMDVPVVDLTEIYDVTDRPEQPGVKLNPEDLESMDAVTVYSNDKGEATHIYVVNHPVESPVYWRADSGKYSSANKKTTREKDENGYYTIPFYVDGEYVELKCNIEGIVNTIDAKNRFKAHTGLVLDENGCIVDNMLAATGIRGLLGCEMYDVTEVNGRTFTAEAMLANNGETYTNTLTDDAPIYNVSLAAKPDVRGKAVDTLEVGDRIAVFENAEGEAMLVFVAHRLVDSPMYFNMTKKYSSATKETTRTPDGNGWYTIELFSEGVTKEYKTKDKSLVTYIDSQNNRGVGLELNGDEITYVWPGECVAGYGALVGYTVQNVTGSIISMTPPNDPETVSNRILHANCKVYNMSGVNQKKGEITELLPEDYCIFWRNPKSELVYVYVIRRKVDAPIYFSMSRKWDSTRQQSTRVPVDGWYVYECASEGKQVTVKTSSKSIADFLDSQSPQSFALKVNSSGVIQEAYETTAVTGGSKAYLNTDVKGINGKELTLYNATNGKTYKPKMAEDCKVYNVSSVYEKLRGERSYVQYKDRIQCYTNAKGEIALIYIRIREVDADIYFSKVRYKEKTADGKTTRPLENGWYVFQCALEGEEVTVKTQDIDVATMMDSQSPQSFALKVKDGIVQKAYPTTAVTGGSTRAVNCIVKSVDNGKIIVKLTNGDDFEMPMASDYKCFNVSGVYDDHWGEKSTIQVGDTLQSYTNKENKVCLVYIRTRPEDVRLYWNVEKQYDSEAKMSTRSRQSDGYFHVLLAVDGAQQEFLVEDQKVINYIDSANGAVACTVKGGIITKAQSAIYGKGVWTSVDAAVIATVQQVNGNVLNIKNGKGETVDIAMASDCAVYDVSGKGDFIGQASSPEVGDYGRIYLNLDKDALYFFIMRRGAPESDEPLKLYWNVEKKYDSVNKVSTREPAEDGYYYFELAVDGEIKTFKSKDEEAVRYTDAANGAVALTLSAKDPTEFVKSQSALYAENVDAAGLNGSVVMAEQTFVMIRKGEEDLVMQLAEDVQIYDVSGKGEFIGQATELQVGDGIGRSYVDENGICLYIYITSRGGSAVETPRKLYWNVNRQKDENGSTRVPDADGWYYIDLAVDGEIKTFKTQNKKIVDYIDKGNGGATALKVDGDVIVAAGSALEGEGVASAGTAGTVKAIDGLKVTVTTTTGEVESTMAAACSVYDVSGESEFIGQYTELRVGDNFRCYNNADNEMLHIYVLARVEVEEEVVYSNDPLVFAEGTTDAKCTYCNKVVTWTALEEVTDKKLTLENGGHYYLSEDRVNNAGYYELLTKEQACVHLNEHNITSISRVFAVGSDATLTIMGNGTVTGADVSTATANLAAATISCRGNMNLIGGTYKHVNSTLPTIIMSRPQRTMNIYEGVTIEGTEGVTGTNLYIMFGVVNLYGGKIVGGTATPGGTTDGHGDNVYVHGWTGSATARAEFNMFDGYVDGGIYATKTGGSYKVSVEGNAVITDRNGGLTLDSASGALLTVGDLGADARIYITANGAVTAETPNAEDYVNVNILPASEDITLEVVDNVIVATVEEAPVEPVIIVKMAYVQDPQYDETNKVTTRVPDADGYYYVGLAIDGEVKIYKTKVTGLEGAGNGIDYVDQSAAKGRSLAVSIIEGTQEFVYARSAIFAPEAKTAKVSTVVAVNGDTITLSDGDFKLAANVEIYDVSDKAAAFGEVTTLRAEDSFRGYLNEAGELRYVYVQTRAEVVTPDPEEPAPVYLYWNVERMRDETNKVSTRTPEADGYYYIKLAVNGEIKTFKTNNRTIIDYIDGKNTGATALTVEGDVIVDYGSALEGDGVETAGKGGDVTAFDGAKISFNNSNEGALEYNLASNAKIYDVSGNSSFIGQETELLVGDNFRCYLNASNEVLYLYVLSRATVEEPEPEPEDPVVVEMNQVFEKANAMAAAFAAGGNVDAQCPVCGVSATWEPLPVVTTANVKLASGHYYVAADNEAQSSYFNVTDGVSVCIHLNGKTLNCDDERVFYVDKASQLSIMGSGNVVGNRSAKAGTQRCGNALEVVGNDTVVNLCGGTWTKGKNDLDVLGVRSYGNGGLNIYDGTVVNSAEGIEGYKLLIASGKVNLAGGEINGDIYVRDWAAATATLPYAIDITVSGTEIHGAMTIENAIANPFGIVLSGDAVIDELIPAASYPVQIGHLVTGAAIKVTAEGVFTTANPNLQSYVDAGYLSAKAEGKIISVTDGVGSVVDAPAVEPEPSVRKAVCAHCGVEKEWTPISENITEHLTLQDGGHYYLTADLANTARINLAQDTSACFDLNGHNITTTGNRVFSAQVRATLSIMGSGTVIGSGITASEYGATISCRGNLNLYGGTYKHQDSDLATIGLARATGVVNMYDGVILEGTEGVTGSNLNIAFGTFNMYGGQIYGGSAKAGDLTGGKGGNLAATATVTGAKTECHFFGGYIDGGVYLANADYTVYTLQGNCVVTAKDGGITTDELLTLGEFASGAEYYITAADGAFTIENANAAEILAAGYLKAADSAKTITVTDNVLYIG